MIKLESVHIEEMRGIRKLDTDFHKLTFAICGPNGSGKSGVIDAIEFGLTGQIGRLMGAGTKGLTIGEHAPHVDMVKFPDAALVRLGLYLTDIKQSATLTRKVKAPSKPTIEPATEDVLRILSEVAEHPEITLSRREILRFILVEPSARAEEIQSILKLDQIGQTRSTLGSANNKIQTAYRNAEAASTTAKEALQRHAQITSLRADELLEAVNKRRQTLQLEALDTLTPDTQLDSGLDAEKRLNGANKKTSLKDLESLLLETQTPDELAAAEASKAVSIIEQLQSNPALFAALQRLSFLERGLELADTPQCPLCDSSFDSVEALAAHLRAKLEKSKDAQRAQRTLSESGAAVGRAAVKLATLVNTALASCDAQGELALIPSFNIWRDDLESFRASLSSVDGIVAACTRLSQGWPSIPPTFHAELKAVTAKIHAKPDQTALFEAQTFLTIAQERLTAYREAMRRQKVAKAAADAAKVSYDTYCAVTDEELNNLYDEVQEDFSRFYRIVNGDDEGGFTAKLTPTEGKLGFDVNFYDRGLFPPAAYHSEGHQDGMGVCLYLALMKRLFGERFTFALLDDVVMSVDVDHRHAFCKLLKTEFPDTQFVITTHDRLWAEQMKAAGLVQGKSLLFFHSWSVDTGPMVESNTEIWDEIEGALEKGKVEVASAALRRHLEYVSRGLANDLAAPIPFRADGNYELGDLLPNVLGKFKKLLGEAANAAQSWGNAAQHQAVLARRDEFAVRMAATKVEEWAVNKAVHFNAWANFGKKDFQPVVAAYKELLESFRCKGCDTWLHITPRNNPEVLRCVCGAVSLTLRTKAK